MTDFNFSVHASYQARKPCNLPLLQAPSGQGTQLGSLFSSGGPGHVVGHARAHDPRAGLAAHIQLTKEAMPLPVHTSQQLAFTTVPQWLVGPATWFEQVRCNPHGQGAAALLRCTAHGALLRLWNIYGTHWVAALCRGHARLTVLRSLQGVHSVLSVCGACCPRFNSGLDTLPVE